MLLYNNNNKKHIYTEYIMNTSEYDTKNKIHKWSQEAKVEFGLSFASVVLVIFLRMFQNIQEDCNMLEDMWIQLQQNGNSLAIDSSMDMSE